MPKAAEVTSSATLAAAPIGGHHLGDQVGEGLDPGRGRGGADHLGAVQQF